MSRRAEMTDVGPAMAEIEGTPHPEASPSDVPEPEFELAPTPTEPGPEPLRRVGDPDGHPTVLWCRANRYWYHLDAEGRRVLHGAPPGGYDDEGRVIPTA